MPNVPVSPALPDRSPPQGVKTFRHGPRGSGLAGKGKSAPQKSEEFFARDGTRAETQQIGRRLLAVHKSESPKLKQTHQPNQGAL